MSISPTRILIAAENASTRFGGEAILPYHYFRLLRARSFDAHLVVHARCRDELQSLFPDDLANLHFVEDQALQKLFFRLGKLLPHRISEATFGLTNQLLTQHAQRGILRRLVTVRCVIHQPIPVSPRFPSLLHSLGAPVVIGPLNGGMEYPSAFAQAESMLSRFLINLGRTFTNFGNTLFPGKRRAAIVLVANQRTRAALPAQLEGRVVELPENAVDTAQWSVPAVSTIDPHRFLFIGRLVDWKALNLVLEALTKVPFATLDVIGDGPMRSAWRNATVRFNIASRVRFLGWQTQAVCAQHLANACALVLPSLYECGGAVVLEAMAMSRPVIATAWGGPADYLDPTCGILLEPVSAPALVAGFAEAMQSLIDSPRLRDQLGAAGRRKLLRDFDWNHKIDRILDLYASTQPPRASS
jgi:glycosyltransferase involved in cell wall biosynthesis